VQDAVQDVRGDPFAVRRHQAGTCHAPARPGAMQGRHVPDGALVELVCAGVRAGRAVTPAWRPVKFHGST
jgi:hypothetical protein